MKINNKIVSIITPIYNAQKFINETIESVIKQTYQDWELILIDDSSTDNSANIIEGFQKKDKRIKYHKLEFNSGAAVARNTGLELAKGRYVAFIDSDDVWLENKLEIQIGIMKNKEYGFTFTKYELIDEKSSSKEKIMGVVEKVSYKFLLKNTVIGCSTVVIDRKIVGDFRMPLIRTRQDNATWLAILKRGNYAFGIDEVLTKYRIVSNSISRNKFKASKKQWQVYREIEKLSLIKAVYYFTCYILNAILKRI